MTKPWRRIGWTVGGAAFVALVAGAWWTRRALVFPKPALSLVRNETPSSGRFYVRSSGVAGPRLVFETQRYDLERDFPAALASLKREVGAELQSVRDGGDTWSWSTGDKAPRGWAVVLSRAPKEVAGAGRILFYRVSWRPQTGADTARRWLYDRLPGHH